MVDLEDPGLAVGPVCPSSPPSPLPQVSTLVDGSLAAAPPARQDAADEELLAAVGALQDAADLLLQARSRVSDVAGVASAVQATLGVVATAVPLAVVTTDRLGVVDEANAAAGHLLGTAFPRLRGKPLQVFVPTDRRREVRSTVARAWRTGAARCCVPLLPRSGAPVEVDVVVVAADTADGSGGLQWVLAPVGARTPPTRPAGATGVTDPIDPTGAAAARRSGAAGRDADAVAALAELCRLEPGTTGLQPLMVRVAALLVRAIPGADHVSVTLGDPLAPSVTAACSTQAQRLDGLQVVCGHGPTVAAWREGVAVMCADLSSEERWARFAAAASARGPAAPAPPVAAAAVPVRSGSEVVGVVTLYGSAAVVSDAAVDRAAIFATAVAALLQRERHVSDLRTTAEQLRTALASRATIEQAKGMVSAWLGCGVDEAFAALARWSQDRNVKLREVAAFVVATPDQARPAVLSRAAA